MSLEIRFDGVLIDEQYYTGLTNNYEMFNESFKLGTTPMNNFKLKIAKEGVSTQPSNVTISDGANIFADLQVDNVEDDDYEYVYTLTDKMANLNFYYDASEIFIEGSTTLYDIALDICDKAGLILGTLNFRGYNKRINWYDNRRTARDYIGYIAELNGGFARITGNTLYFIKQKRNSLKTISIDDCEDYKLGEYHKITRVVYELGTLKYEFGNDTGNTLYLNGENVFITEEAEVEGIYNDIKDFEFYSFSTGNCPIDYALKVGDPITFTDGTNNYPTIVQYDLEYYGGWTGGYDLSVNTEKQEETKVIGNKENIKNLQITVDRQNNIIKQTIEEVEEQSSKISELNQTVDGLSSTVSNIAITTATKESNTGVLNFEKINAGQPVKIEIHPIDESITELYPFEKLYPSENLFIKLKTLRFSNTTTGENIDYNLPDDLLIYDPINYDTFILDYENQRCYIKKKCKYNEKGEIELLEEETIEEFSYPIINITDGDYIIKILKYSNTPYNAYLLVSLMEQNVYTKNFATKVELSSSITQTADEINLRVDEKLDEEDFTSANILLKINNDESSATIKADKINLNGAVTANDNFKILTDGSMEAKNGTFTDGSILLNTSTSMGSIIRVIKTNDTSNRVDIGYDSVICYKNGTQYTAGIGPFGANSWITKNQQINAIGIDAPLGNITYLGCDTVGKNSGLICDGLNLKLCSYTEDYPIKCRNTQDTAYTGIEAKAFYTESSKRYKENIRELKDYELIYKLKPVAFDYKKDSGMSGQNVSGLIAEETFEVLPQIVGTIKLNGEEVPNSIDYSKLIPYLLKAVQEQQKQIEELKNEIKILKEGK